MLVQKLIKRRFYIPDKCYNVLNWIRWIPGISNTFSPALRIKAKGKHGSDQAFSYQNFFLQDTIYTSRLYK